MKLDLSCETRLSPGVAGCGIPAAIGRATQPPILPCTERGFSCCRRCRRRGGLLPHLFTLTLREPPCGESTGRFVFCDTIRRRALRRGARTCLAARAASCPVVSGLSSPRPYRARRSTAPWDVKNSERRPGPKTKRVDVKARRPKSKDGGFRVMYQFCRFVIPSRARNLTI